MDTIDKWYMKRVVLLAIGTGILISLGVYILQGCSNVDKPTTGSTTEAKYVGIKYAINNFGGLPQSGYTRILVLSGDSTNIYRAETPRLPVSGTVMVKTGQTLIVEFDADNNNTGVDLYLYDPRLATAEFPEGKIVDSDRSMNPGHLSVSYEVK